MYILISFIYSNCYHHNFVLDLLDKWAEVNIRNVKPAFLSNCIQIFYSSLFIYFI